MVIISFDAVQLTKVLTKAFRLKGIFTSSQKSRSSVAVFWHSTGILCLFKQVILRFESSVKRLLALCHDVLVYVFIFKISLYLKNTAINYEAFYY